MRILGSTAWQPRAPLGCFSGGRSALARCEGQDDEEALWQMYALSGHETGYHLNVAMER